MDTEKINKAYDELRIAKSNHYKAAFQYALARADLENEKAAALRDGRIDGKNAELREAVARELFPKIYGRLEKLDELQREARFILDVAQIEVDRLDMIIRYLTIQESL